MLIQSIYIAHLIKYLFKEAHLADPCEGEHAVVSVLHGQ